MQSRKNTWIVWGRASGVTTLAAIVGTSLAAVLQSLSLLGVGGPMSATSVALFGACVVGILAAAVIAYAVSRLDRGIIRSVWTMAGIAVLLGTLADSLWAFSEVVSVTNRLGANLGDVLYLISYVLFAAAVVRWLLVYRDRVDLASVATEALLVSAAVGAVVWFGLLGPGVHALGELTPSMVEDLAWVILDLPLIVAPLIALCLVLVRLRDEELVSLWAAFGGSMVLTVLADIGWFWERSHGGWLPGSLTNFGFMVSSVLLAVGALTALDLQADRAAARRSAEDLAA